MRVIRPPPKFLKAIYAFGLFTQFWKFGFTLQIGFMINFKF